VFTSKVRWQDTFGGKAKVVYTGGRLNAYAQGIF
jgi:hypothetical protein